MNFDMRLLAYCGLYCDQCSCRAAFADQDMRHMAHMPDKYREARPTPADIGAMALP